MEESGVFVAWIVGLLDGILAERFARMVSHFHRIRFEGMTRQVPAVRHRCHDVKAKMSVPYRIDGCLAVFHGTRKLVDYQADGRLRLPEMKAVS